MSRFEKDENENPNPAERFFDWIGDSSDGKTGSVSYYDKVLKEKVEVPLPFAFWVIDKVVQVTGGLERNGKYEGFWSNAVKNPAKQKIIVKSKAGIEAEGFWVENDLKGREGLKYMTGLYIGFMDDDEMKLGYFRVKGSALTSWIEITKEQKDIYQGGFIITGGNKRKKGSNVYYTPVFEFVPDVESETLDDLMRIYIPLRDYLKEYFAKGPDTSDRGAENDSGVEIDQTEQEFSGLADRDINDDLHAANADSKVRNEDAPELIALCQELNKFSDESDQWTPGKLKSHVQEQFDKPLNDLDGEEMDILITDMTDTLKERRAIAEEAVKPKAKDKTVKTEVPSEPMATKNQCSTLRKLMDIKDIDISEMEFLSQADPNNPLSTFEKLTQVAAGQLIIALNKR